MDGTDKGNSIILQHHICVTCGRQFIKNYDRPNSYDEQTKQECLIAYVNGMGFRAIERLKGVHHTTIIHWVKSVGTQLPNANDPEASPEVAELDELETFVGSKKQNLAVESC